MVPREEVAPEGQLSDSLCDVKDFRTFSSRDFPGRTEDAVSDCSPEKLPFAENKPQQ